MKQFIILLAGLFFMAAAYADVSRVEATIDKNPVMVDEAIRLTVRAEGDADRDAFDSSPLLKDFVVGRTSVSSQTSIVNFDTTQTTSWTTTLFPRAEGKFTIPAFTIEGKKTAPIEVNVIPVSGSGDQPVRDYYVTTDVDTSTVYLQQQIRYTVKLFLASNIERGSLQAPELKSAQIRQLGEDKQYTDIVNGKRYQIIERNFAIVPEQSGELIVKGPVFSGEVLAPNTNQRFGFFNRTQSINRVGPDISITVKPQPQGLVYHWLPSEFVSLEEEWQKDKGFIVGEPVTRTVTLTAMGVVEEQLPELPQHYPPNFKLYPDQANTATVDKDNLLIAQRVESIAIIPTQAGNFVLPDITVPWFNVLTGKTEYATLPARSIEVKAASGSAQQPTPADNAVLSSPAVDTVATKESSPVEPTQANPSYTTWILIVLWLLTIIGWSATVYHYRMRQAGPASVSNKNSSRFNKANVNADEAQLYRQLEDAVRQENPGLIQHTLAQWLTVMHPEGRTVRRPDSWAMSAPLQPFIDDLLSSRYGSGQRDWNNQALLNALQATRQAYLKKHSAGGKALAGLYPDSKK
ncbi:BatD family protein [Alteromonas pelagimontana]|nr:BatD family protein [Alteromonas pelagimontana]